MNGVILDTLSTAIYYNVQIHWKGRSMKLYVKKLIWTLEKWRPKHWQTEVFCSAKKRIVKLNIKRGKKPNNHIYESDVRML